MRARLEARHSAEALKRLSDARKWLRDLEAAMVAREQLSTEEEEIWVLEMLDATGDLCRAYLDVKNGRP